MISKDFTEFLSLWMKDNKNYHCDWCWTKTNIYMNGEDITKDLLTLYLMRSYEV